MLIPGGFLFQSPISDYELNKPIISENQFVTKLFQFRYIPKIPVFIECTSQGPITEMGGSSYQLYCNLSKDVKLFQSKTNQLIEDINTSKIIPIPKYFQSLWNR